jgi:NAD(P)-dependent dehydrogenase (short-subunit alcohol dehydrogenase family)
MSRVFITGSSDGLGLMAARLLIEQGHQVFLHGRNDSRSREALAAAAGAAGVVTGDLSTIAETRSVANAANKLGPFDSVIHNAGVGYRESRRLETEPGVPRVFAVNVLAPYISHRADRHTEAAGLSQLRHAPRRAAANGRSALDQARLGRFNGLCGKQAVRCVASLRHRTALEERSIECFGARMGGDQDGRSLGSG